MANPWVCVRRSNGWYAQHSANCQFRGAYRSSRTAQVCVDALNRRHEQASVRKELAAFIRCIRDADVGTIAVLADWQKEHGRTDNAERLRSIFEECNRVRRRQPGTRDRLDPGERLGRAITRACTHALRSLDDWWIRRRLHKDQLAQRAREAAAASLRPAVENAVSA